jgi:hypothetical protein
MKAPLRSNQCDCRHLIHGVVVAYLVFSLPWLMIPLAFLLGFVWLGCSVVDGCRAYQLRKAELAEQQRRHERAEHKWAEWRSNRNSNATMLDRSED